MNKKVLATAMVVMGLFPSLLFAQLYRIEVDAQESGSQKVIDRVFTGNTVGLQVSFYDGGDPLPVTNWTMRFMYGYGQYDTNGMVPVVGTAGASNNVVVFDSATNVFFSENGSYYFSIVGTNAAGKVRTFARGRMIEEYDPATGGSYSNGIPMPWANLNFASKEWIVEYISTNEFETVVSYGTNSTTAYRGDWGASVSNLAAQAAGWGDHAAAGYATGTPIYAETDSIALAAIVTNGAVASNAYAAATNAQQVANAALPASATNGAEWGSHAGLVKTNHIGKVDVDGMLNVNRTSFSTNLTEWDFTFRAWNNANAEFTVDTRSDEHPWWSLENQEGWIYFTFENSSDLWVTKDIWYNERNKATIHANIDADYLSLLDSGEGGYKLYVSGGDVYGHYTNAATSVLWTQHGFTNYWLGRVNDTEANRIAAIAEASGGISASTATNIAQTVLSASTNAHDGTARASIVAVGAVASNATTAAQAGGIATAAVASASATPYVITYGATNILIDPANGYRQWLSATNAVTLNFPATATGEVQAIALDILPAASITWATSNLNLGTVTMTTGSVQTVLFRSAAGTNGWIARK